MKKLYLIRHAKSSWDDVELDDFDRLLNKRGEKDAPRMGKRLREKRITPHFMITSPALRAQETCKIIAHTLGFPESKIITDKRLYHADSSKLLAVINDIPNHKSDTEEVVLLFGHNPGLTEFANELLNQSIVNIPTCGIVVAALLSKTWKEVTFGCGQMEYFDYPKNH